MRAIFGSGVVRGTSIVFSLLISILLARLLGPEGFGTYSFALAVITVVGLPVHMGLPTLVIRETARALSNADWPRMNGIWRWAGRLNALYSALTILIMIAGALLFRDELTSPTGFSTFAISLFLIPIIAIAQIRGASLRGLNHPILGLLPENSIRPGAMTLFFVMAIAFAYDLTPRDAMTVHVAGALLSLAFSVACLHHWRPAQIAALPADISRKREWRSALWPLAMIAGTQIAIQNVNLAVLGIWRTPEEVGLFKIAISASNLVLLGHTVVNLVFAPDFARFYEIGHMSRLDRHSRLAAALSLLSALPLALILLFQGEPILSFFYGEAFAASHIPLVIIIGGQLITAFFGSCFSLLNMSGHERETLRALLIAMVLNLVLNVILVPSYGMTGSAYAILLSTLAWNILIAGSVRKKLRVATTPFRLARPT